MMSAANMPTDAPGMQQQSQASAGLSYMLKALGMLAAKPDLAFDDVVNFAANLVRLQMMPPNIAAEQLSQVPRDRGQMRAWALLRQADLAIQTHGGTQPQTGS